MNKRMKEARKALNFSQEEFGQRIGLSKFAISNYENGKQTITERSVANMCREFGINEKWLRTGEGDMFDVPDSFSLDEYAKVNGLSALEIDIIKTYMEMPAKTRQAALAVLYKMFGRGLEEAEIEMEGEAFKEELRAEKFTQTASASQKPEGA